ncbi:MAG: formate/nitrite transporter family protein [Hyphomicrobiales bacterium]
MRQDQVDAYSPSEIALRVEVAGQTKAHNPAHKTLILAVLAGAFIAFGALLYIVVTTNSGLGFGPERLLGGISFSLGLILIVVGGAELFTGNILMVFAWADRKIFLSDLLKSWTIVYVGNLIGAATTAYIIYLAGTQNLANGGVGETAIKIASAKVELAALEAITRGVLCNVLVCLAVWLSFSARTVPGKIMAIVFPVTGFVAMGFEHSIANMFFLPFGHLSGASSVTLHAGLYNLLLVSVGNLIGGGLLVGLVYWLVYGRPSRSAPDDNRT